MTSTGRIPTMHEGNPLQGHPSTGSGQPKRSSADCATSGAEVCAGVPFFGGVWRKSESGERIYLATIPAEDPLTVNEAFEQIEGFGGTVVISTIIEGEAQELTASVGHTPEEAEKLAEVQQATSHQTESERDSEPTRAPDIERQLRRAEQQCTQLRRKLRDEREERQELEDDYDRRLRRMKDRHAEALERRENLIENERTMRRGVEEEVSRLKRQHADEIAQLSRRHKDEIQRVREERKGEIERLRAEIDRLKDEKNDLYIENRLSSPPKSNLDRFFRALLDNMDKISDTVFAGIMQYGQKSQQQGTRGQLNGAAMPALGAASGDGAMNGAPSVEAPEPHANGQTERSRAATASTPANGREPRTEPQPNPPAQPEPDAGVEADAGPDVGDATSPIEQFRSMDKPTILASVLGTAVAAVEGEYDRDDFPEAIDVVTGLLDDRGEPITPEEWARLVHGLAMQTVEHDLPTKEVAETIRPIVRRFVKPGSAVETALRTSPAGAAASMLIGATGLDPGDEVRTVVTDVLRHYKKTL